MTTNVRRSREAKAQTREEPVVQETEQEERVQTLPRRKPRQLAQKVRVESAVVEPVTEIVPEAVVAEVIAPQSEPVKAELPAGVESVADRDENGESREANGMPRRSPRHLRVSGQRRRRYRDERYPTRCPYAADRSLRIAGMAQAKSGSATRWFVRRSAQPEEFRFRTPASRKLSRL